MQSGELARLAGVSVRALRHYHQVGVLDEPARGSNGYRRYDVHDLIRVLRIKRLASLGIPLERMVGLLDDADDGAGQLLDELDRELAGRVARLTRQRELIPQLRDHQTPPDLPPDLAKFLAVFVAAGLSPALAKVDRDQSVLLAHLVGEEGMPHLVRHYERMADPRVLPEVTNLTERFEQLQRDSSDQDVEAIVEDFVTIVAPVIAEDAGSDPPIDFRGSAGLINDYTKDRLNAPQRRVLELIEARLDLSSAM